ALIPAGVFYLNLRGDYAGGDFRDEVLNDSDAVQSAYKHSGRFDFAKLKYLDNSGANSGTQFNYRLTNAGAFNKTAKGPMDSAEFEQLLTDVEANLVRMGQNIYQGAIKPNPYQKGKDRACGNCEYQGVCRIDPWMHQFRVLQ